MAGVEYLSPEGLRVDGRRPPELRRMQCKMGVFQQADGSVFLEMGNTKVLATVYGPHDVSKKSQALHDKAIINCQFSMASFSTSERKKRPKGDSFPSQLRMEKQFLCAKQQLGVRLVHKHKEAWVGPTDRIEWNHSGPDQVAQLWYPILSL